MTPTQHSPIDVESTHEKLCCCLSFPALSQEKFPLIVLLLYLYLALLVRVPSRL